MRKLFLVLLLNLTAVYAQDFSVSFSGKDWHKENEDLNNITYSASFNLTQEVTFTDNDKMDIYSYKQYKLLFRVSRKIHKLEISGIEPDSRTTYNQIEAGSWYKHTMSNDDELITFNSYSILAKFKVFVKVKKNPQGITRGGPVPKPEEFTLHLSLETQPLKIDDFSDVITKIGVGFLGFDGLAKIRGVNTAHLEASKLEESKRETEFKSLSLRGKYEKYDQSSSKGCIIL